MPVSLSWVIEAMERLAPEALAEEWDNTGLQIGDREQIVQRVLVALDFNEQVAQAAAEAGADLVITHHPLIFRPLKSVTADYSTGRRIIYAIRHNIAVYAAHTNLDRAQGGTNDILFENLELKDMESLEATQIECALGRVGRLDQEMSLGELALHVGERLYLDNVRYVGDRKRTVRKVGICSGAGADPKYLTWAAKKGCDVYITGDVKYHDAQAALEMGLSLIDATHYGSEVIALAGIRRYLTDEAQRAGVELQVDVSCDEEDIIKNIWKE